jgi:hypothetical protein
VKSTQNGSGKRNRQWSERNFAFGMRLAFSRCKKQLAFFKHRGKNIAAGAANAGGGISDDKTQ